MDSVSPFLAKKWTLAYPNHMSMYQRLIQFPRNQSFFLFGPRGTGKTSWITREFKDCVRLDLLDDEIYNKLLANPKSIQSFVPKNNGNKFIIIDEIQKVPKLLDEVHRLIEEKKWRFVLTGSNARKLKRSGGNLLAGRALSYEMHPFTARELKTDFDLSHALMYGTLPLAVTGKEPKKFLASYVKTYLKEEVQLEGLTRNIESFARFLQIASFSQGSPLVLSNVASEASINRKVVEDYFSILRDLLLSVEVPIFSRRAKRELISKAKFYFFDAGVFRTLRPKGPLDSDTELNGQALETLVLNEIRALNDYMDLGYEIFYWRTRDHKEVDFVIYGQKGFWAIEVKSGTRIGAQDLVGLKAFCSDYPQAQAVIIYGGSDLKKVDDILYIPAEQFFRQSPAFFE